MSNTAFDKPEWVLRPPQKFVDTPEEACIVVDISVSVGTLLGKVKLVPSPQMLTFLHDVFGYTKYSDAVGYYLEQEGNRWYFGVMGEFADMDLWYYTPSTLPHWAKQVIDKK